MKKEQKLQKEWACSKYLVMAHSQKHYNQIRKLFKEPPELPEFEEKYQQLLEEALAVEITTGSFVNTAHHIWGYFKKSATPDEKRQFLDKIEEYSEGQIENQEIIDYLKELSIQYSVEYLLNSRLLFKE